MVKLLKIAVPALSLMLLAGCTSFKTSNSYMSIRDASPAVPEAGHALFIFQRDNARVAEWSSLGIWEITDDKPQLIGLLHGTMKAAWSVAPGSHDFMLNIGGAAQVLKATAVAGKTYYVELNHNLYADEGPSAYRFCPVRSDTDNAMTNTEIGWFNTSSDEEASGRLDSANKHIAKVRKVWDDYSAELKQRFTMHATDGR